MSNYLYTIYMINAIQQFFASGSGSFLSTLFISMLPICEARVGMPFGMSNEIWGAKALSPFTAFLASFLGSSLASMLIILLLKPIFQKLKNTKLFKNIIAKLEAKFKKQGSDMEKDDTSKNKTFAVWTAIMLFVAIPAPMTGVWAGSGIACFTRLNFWQSLSSVIVGNLLACVLLMLVCTIFKDSILFLLIASIIMIVISVIIYLLSSKRKAKAIEKANEV